MAWTYDETDLDKTTTSGRLNVVRLLIGDTDTNDQLVKNEEIIYVIRPKLFFSTFHLVL